MEEEDVEALAHGGQVELHPDGLTHGSGLAEESSTVLEKFHQLFVRQRPRLVDDLTGKMTDPGVGSLREGSSLSQVGCQISVHLMDVGLDIRQTEID